MSNLLLRGFNFLKSSKVLYSTSSPYFITTPIFYVNAAPHLGHLYTTVITDAAHRFYQLTHPNEPTLFATGTDEHGLKVQQAAKASEPEQVKRYCDTIAAKYKELFDLCGITYSTFIRTTDEAHIEAVKSFWNLLQSKGHIYKGSYSGWYCVPDEMFVTEKQLKMVKDENGQDVRVSEVSGHRVEWTQEENYMFRLSSFRSDLLYWLENETRIVPHMYYKILRSWLNDEHSTFDISVSRPRSRIPWGIPIPSDPSQNVYVWLDALVNYLTVAGFPNLRCWPPSVQVIGKDILKFHGIYWPIFLIAAGLEPPRQLLVHSHWTVDDVKMSKSKNNVINPFEKVQQYTVDGFKYFLLKQGVPHADGNYTETKVIEMLNADLANTFGNLLNRSVGKTVNSEQIFPPLDKNVFDSLYAESESLKALSERISKLTDDVSRNYNNFNFHLGIDSTMLALHECNRFFDECKPWELRKKEADFPKLKCVIHVTLETLRICSIALLPIVPSISREVFRKLNINEKQTRWTAMKPSWLNDAHRSEDGPLNSERIILYTKHHSHLHHHDSHELIAVSDEEIAEALYRRLRNIDPLLEIPPEMDSGDKNQICQSVTGSDYFSEVLKEERVNMDERLLDLMLEEPGIFKSLYNFSPLPFFLFTSIPPDS